MKELAAVLGVGVVLAGCASKIEVPVTGQLGDGTPAAGMATANTNGTGTFWVKIPAGPRCAGRYDPYDRSPSIVVPVACTDGRTGETVITRELSGLSGTAIVQLSDGTRGQFVFGDLTFQQAFGSGSAETPTTLRVRSN